MYVVLGFLILGLSKGFISGKGMMKRFPKRKKSALIAAVFLVGVFAISAGMSLDKLSSLEFQDESKIKTPDEFIETLSDIDLVLFASGFILPAIIFLLGYGKYKKTGKTFLLIMTIVYYSLYVVYLTLDFVPKEFLMTLFMVFQFGTVFGVMIGTGLHKKI